MATATKKSKKKKRQEPLAEPVPPNEPGALSRAVGEATRVLLPDSVAGRRILLGILVAAFGFRVAGLVSWMPILGDESIYLRWAEIVEHQGEWFISLLDAKPPLQTWLLAIVRMLVGVDPLLEGRLISVGAALLATLGLFAVGRLLSGDRAGLIAAALYAFFPIAIFHEKLAYTEPMVNAFGIAFTAASLWVFEKPKPDWGRLVVLGLLLGVGVFTKQSTLLFLHVPVLVGLWRGRAFPVRLVTGGLVVIAIAGLFFVVTMVAIPTGPDTDWRNPAVHRADYYVTTDQLLDDPFRKVPINWPKLMRAGKEHVTWPMLIVAAFSLCYLLWKKPFAALLLTSICAIPLFVQCMVLSGALYPVRWAYPHFWPLVALAGLGAAEIWQAYVERLPSMPVRAAIGAAAAVLVVGPMSSLSAEMFRDPEPFLRVGTYMAHRAQVGYANREAIDFLAAEAAEGPLVVLTDPIPGPPADSMFPYLNHRRGITVYDAWWMKLGYKHPILPIGAADIMKSMYQRVTEKVIYFSRVKRVYYVTDTFYHTEEAVHDRQPNAKKVASFPKPFEDEAVEVYRLK